MEAAAILRMNACEIFGLAVCKAESVYGNNPDYIKLLELVGLPTIRDMALTDAVSTVRQVANVYPEFFTDDISVTSKIGSRYGSQNVRISQRNRNVTKTKYKVSKTNLLSLSNLTRHDLT